jgi:hypothetical protein
VPPTGIDGSSPPIPRPVGYLLGMSPILPQAVRPPTLRSEPFSSRSAMGQRNKNCCALLERWFRTFRDRWKHYGPGGPNARRRVADIRSSGAAEAMAGRVDDGTLAAKMANTIDQARELQRTYLPVDPASVARADDARLRGRLQASEENESGRKSQNCQRYRVRRAADCIDEFMALFPPYRRVASPRSARAALRPEWGARPRASMRRRR